MSRVPVPKNRISRMQEPQLEIGAQVQSRQPVKRQLHGNHPHPWHPRAAPRTFVELLEPSLSLARLGTRKSRADNPERQLAARLRSRLRAAEQARAAGFLDRVVRHLQFPWEQANSA